MTNKHMFWTKDSYMACYRCERCNVPISKYELHFSMGEDELYGECLDRLAQKRYGGCKDGSETTEYPTEG